MPFFTASNNLIDNSINSNSNTLAVKFSSNGNAPTYVPVPPTGIDFSFSLMNRNQQESPQYLHAQQYDHIDDLSGANTTSSSFGHVGSTFDPNLITSSPPQDVSSTYERNDSIVSSISTPTNMYATSPTTTIEEDLQSPCLSSHGEIHLPGSDNHSINCFEKNLDFDGIGYNWNSNSILLSNGDQDETFYGDNNVRVDPNIIDFDLNHENLLDMQLPNEARNSINSSLSQHTEPQEVQSHHLQGSFMDLESTGVFSQVHHSSTNNSANNIAKAYESSCSFTQNSSFQAPNTVDTKSFNQGRESQDSGCVGNNTFAYSSSNNNKNSESLVSNNCQAHYFSSSGGSGGSGNSDSPGGSGGSGGFGCSGCSGGSGSSGSPSSSNEDDDAAAADGERGQKRDRNGRKLKVWRNRKFKCGQHCNQSFTDLDEFARHIREVEETLGPHNSGRKFKCDKEKCPWRIIGFMRKNECQKHYKRSHGECDIQCRFWRPDDGELFPGSKPCTTRWHYDCGNRRRHEVKIHGLAFVHRLEEEERRTKGKSKSRRAFTSNL